MRQKQEVGCIIRGGGHNFYSAPDAFCGDGINEDDKVGNHVCSDKIRNVYTAALELPEGQVTREI